MLLKHTIDFVQQQMKNNDAGHDFCHIQRVLALAETIAKQEAVSNPQINLELVQLGALLHDVADWKFHNGDETVGPRIAAQFLSDQGVNEEIIDKVCKIIKEISFKGNNVPDCMSSIEGNIVQDADRLDAIGAIGIARTFTYGGYRNRPLYCNTPPQIHNSAEEYKKNQSSTINHFHEKLLLLKDRMNTKTGRKIAERRHQFMLQFLEQFNMDVEGVMYN